MQLQYLKRSLRFNKVCSSSELTLYYFFSCKTSSLTPSRGFLMSQRPSEKQGFNVFISILVFHVYQVYSTISLAFSICLNYLLFLVLNYKCLRAVDVFLYCMYLPCAKRSVTCYLWLGTQSTIRYLCGRFVVSQREDTWLLQNLLSEGMLYYIMVMTPSILQNSKRIIKTNLLPTLRFEKWAWNPARKLLQMLWFLLEE